MKSFLRILQSVKPYMGLVILAAFFNLLTVVFSIGSVGSLIPILNLIFETPGTELGHAAVWKAKLAAVVQAHKLENGSLETLKLVILGTTILFILKNLSRYAALWLMAPVRNGVVAHYKEALHRKWLVISLRAHGKAQKGDLLTRATADLNEIEWSMLKGMEGFVRDPLMIIGTLIVLFTMSPVLTGLAIAIIPISGGLIVTVGRSLKRSAKKAQEELGQNTSLLEEALSNVAIVQGFVANEAFKRRYELSLENWRKHMISVFRKRDLSSPIAEILGVGVLLVVLYLGGKEVLEGNKLTGGELVAFIVLFYQLIPAFKNLTNALYDIQKGNASANRILEVIDMPEPKQGSVVPSEDMWSKGLCFDKVHFSYDADVQALNGIDIKIAPGRTTALVGPSGGGKTTVLHLMAGFDQPSKGSVKLGDTLLEDLLLDSYRKELGWVPQHAMLFNDTVAFNVSMSLTPDMAKVDKALEAAQCLDFVSKLKPSAFIGEGGKNLSGGQRQRLCIARAYYANPTLLLLDEATAALDNESEARVQNALESLMKDRTTVVVAHRLSTVQRADNIVYIDHGRLIEQGSHIELMAKEGKYASLVALGILSTEK